MQREKKIFAVVCAVLALAVFVAALSYWQARRNGEYSCIDLIKAHFKDPVKGIGSYVKFDGRNKAVNYSFEYPGNWILLDSYWASNASSQIEIIGPHVVGQVKGSSLNVPRCSIKIRKDTELKLKPRERVDEIVRFLETGDEDKTRPEKAHIESRRFGGNNGIWFSRSQERYVMTSKDVKPWQGIIRHEGFVFKEKDVIYEISFTVIDSQYEEYEPVYRHLLSTFAAR